MWRLFSDHVTGRSWCDAASCTSIRLFLLFPISCPNLCRTLQSSGLRSDVERRTQFSLLLNVKIAIQASRHWSHGFFVVSLVWVVCRYYYECWTIQPREILILFKVTARFVWSRVTLTFRVEVWKDSIKQKILPCLWTFEASSTIEANSEVCLFATKSQINSPYISDKLATVCVSEFRSTSQWTQHSPEDPVPYLLSHSQLCDVTLMR